jgi:hypothetical protein
LVRAPAIKGYRAVPQDSHFTMQMLNDNLPRARQIGFSAGLAASARL